MKPAVFLDRDGTLAKDVHYCQTSEDFELFSTTPEAIRSLREPDIDIKRSYDGSHELDVKAGKATGCKTILLSGDVNITQEELEADHPITEVQTL